jgi:serine protease AprX
MTVPRRARTRLASLLLAALSAAGLPALPGGAAAGPLSAARSTPDHALARLDPEVRTTGSRPVRVVVRARPDATGAAEDAVRRLGGRVTRALPLVDGFAATLPAQAVPRLAARTGVRAISADRAVALQSGSWEEGAAQLAPQVLRAPTAWAGGATGRGVTVAVLDTGVTEVPDLAGRVVPVTDDSTGRTAACHDLSGEGTCADSFGHGTF